MALGVACVLVVGLLAWTLAGRVATSQAATSTRPRNSRARIASYEQTPVKGVVPPDVLRSRRRREWTIDGETLSIVTQNPLDGQNGPSFGKVSFRVEKGEHLFDFKGQAVESRTPSR
ncbi:MAG: hypothetical protein U0835_12920 [Isosphaeraceae bacterium]